MSDSVRRGGGRTARRPLRAARSESPIRSVRVSLSEFLFIRVASLHPSPSTPAPPSVSLHPSLSSESLYPSHSTRVHCPAHRGGTHGGRRPAGRAGACARPSPCAYRGVRVPVRAGLYILVYSGIFWYILVYSGTFWYISASRRRRRRRTAACVHQCARGLQSMDGRRHVPMPARARRARAPVRVVVCVCARRACARARRLPRCAAH